MIKVRTLAAAGALAMSAAPALAASFVSANVNTNANTFLGDVFQGNPGISVTHNASASSLPGAPLTAQQSLSVSTAAPSSAFSGQDRVTSIDDATASFVSANAGSFDAESSWDAVLPDPRGAGFAEMDNADKSVGVRPAFDYAFTATGDDNLFSMTFNVTPVEGIPNIQRGAWDMNLLEDGHSVQFQSLFDGGSGTFSGALVAGHNYELRLRDNAGLVLPDTTFRSFQASDSAQFNFRIGHSDTVGGVPEPTTWALCILGFGFTGAALRRAARMRLA